MLIKPIIIGRPQHIPRIPRSGRARGPQRERVPGRRGKPPHPRGRTVPDDLRGLPMRDVRLVQHYSAPLNGAPLNI